MRALCLITARPETAAPLAVRLRRRRKAVKYVIPVTGRADLCVFMQGSIDEINSSVIEFKRLKDVVTTETLMEVEVNLGW
ncbi:MAG: hypothetical protein OXU86_07110 [Thaumarchaeota archaeon]|nr:hypothetical protein [Nitrososphaerota archaeon]RNJ73396.1 MAG: hypothetical protein EB833_02950 [Thaumarchaeota archaeon S13]RNJ74147.1 MAG: hypothetical protein EB832_00505 [Thaumarchaeota archaeon S14]RNJ75267.1 MAG: hypothetical protein EB824_01965 [Thaumarchaeota archaeon S15]MDD9808925.1 hypothetical protein [Nitrososphaerota archaeon]